MNLEQLRRSRHWRERFNPNADFVFMKTVTVAMPEGKTRFTTGCIVTEEVRSLLGRGRLKRWWQAKVIRVRPKGYEVPEGVEPELLEEAPEAVIEEPSTESPEAPAPAELSDDTETPEQPEGEMAHVAITHDGETGETEVRVDGELQEQPSTGTGEVEAPESDETSEDESAQPEATEAVGLGYSVEEIDGGWYLVHVEGEEEPRRVQGEAALEELKASLTPGDE